MLGIQGIFKVYDQSGKPLFDSKGVHGFLLALNGTSFKMHGDTFKGILFRQALSDEVVCAYIK